MADSKDPQKKDETQPGAKSDAPSVPPTDQAAPASSEKPRKLDETIPGGRYLGANGIFVDANGVPLKDQGKK